MRTSSAIAASCSFLPLSTRYASLIIGQRYRERGSRWEGRMKSVALYSLFSSNNGEWKPVWQMQYIAPANLSRSHARLSFHRDALASFDTFTNYITQFLLYLANIYKICSKKKEMTSDKIRCGINSVIMAIYTKKMGL